MNISQKKASAQRERWPLPRGKRVFLITDKERRFLYDLVADNGDETISGTKLAEKIGIPYFAFRTAVVMGGGVQKKYRQLIEKFIAQEIDAKAAEKKAE